jgi:hypothetical protein
MKWEVGKIYLVAETGNSALLFKLIKIYLPRLWHCSYLLCLPLASRGYTTLSPRRWWLKEQDFKKAEEIPLTNLPLYIGWTVYPAFIEVLGVPSHF